MTGISMVNNPGLRPRQKRRRRRRLVSELLGLDNGENGEETEDDDEESMYDQSPIIPAADKKPDCDPVETQDATEGLLEPELALVAPNLTPRWALPIDPGTVALTIPAPPAATQSPAAEATTQPTQPTQPPSAAQAQPPSVLSLVSGVRGSKSAKPAPMAESLENQAERDRILNQMRGLNTLPPS